MKKSLILLGLLLTIISCDKNDDNENTDSLLIGEWQLIEVLADPGDGSGTFRSVESDKFIKFHDDGKIISNGAICNTSIESDLVSSGTYSLADSTISSPDCSESAIKISFELQGTNLILNYPCIEPCRAKFEKK